MFRKKTIHWIEVNARIVESIFSTNSWGTEITHARNESQRRVKLTIEIPLKGTPSIQVTRKFWTFTKNRNFFQKGEFITVLYNQENPKQFKLKYAI